MRILTCAAAAAVLLAARRRRSPTREARTSCPRSTRSPAGAGVDGRGRSTATTSCCCSNNGGEHGGGRGLLGEPYARIEPDGTVSVNTDSQAYYINEERDGKVEVPDRRRLQGRAALEGGLADRPLRVARPPHALDVRGRPRGGQGQGRAHEGVRLEGADRGRRARRRDRRNAVLDAACRLRRRRCALIIAFAVLVIALLVAVMIVRRRRRGRRTPRPEAW